MGSNRILQEMRRILTWTPAGAYTRPGQKKSWVIFDNWHQKNLLRCLEYFYYLTLLYNTEFYPQHVLQFTHNAHVILPTFKISEWQIHIACIQCWDTPDDGQWTCPKHVEYFIKWIWERVHLVGFHCKYVRSGMHLLLENYVTGSKRLKFLEIFIVPFCPIYDSEDKISLQIILSFGIPVVHVTIK